jgi:hypothetical protein
MADPEIVVMMDSDEAASVKTVTGWVSRDGFFYGKDERAARFAGCTHRPCEECGVAVAKSTHRILCDVCSKVKRLARYLAMPVVEWVDGMAYDYRTDEWFSDEDAVRDYYEENEIGIASAQLVTSEPVYADEVDPLDIYEGDLPDDGEVPDDVAVAFATLNAAIRAARSVLCWRPVDKRIVMSADAEVVSA